ncbi:hypothetical protein GGR50DRAFT_696328 [Xylaria sp. CBS 124048]|nr:hypothetical protein GGR50DRAFT_696328 [Xylaria sp. CBS 124048]
MMYAALFSLLSATGSLAANVNNTSADNSKFLNSFAASVDATGGSSSGSSRGGSSGSTGAAGNRNNSPSSSFRANNNQFVTVQGLNVNSFILPTVSKSHNVATNNNANENDNVIEISRGVGDEISALVQFDIPSSAAGSNCTLTLATSQGDTETGTAQVSLFTSNIHDLANQNTGNLRNQPGGRLDFDATEMLFIYDAGFAPLFSNFACPAGQTLVFEGVAVGDNDTLAITQDTSVAAGNIPSGFSLGIVSK